MNLQCALLSTRSCHPLEKIFAELKKTHANISVLATKQNTILPSFVEFASEVILHRLVVHEVSSEIQVSSTIKTGLQYYNYLVFCMVHQGF